MKKSIIITLVAVFLSVGCFAQPNAAAQPEGREMPTAEQIAKRKAERLKQQLLLSQEQYDKVYRICLEQAENDIERMKQYKAEREKVSAEMKGILNETQYERYEKMQHAPHHGRFSHRNGAPARPEQSADNAKKCDKCEDCKACKECKECKGCPKKENTVSFKSPTQMNPQRGERMQLPADRRRNQNAYHYTQEADKK